MWTRYFNLLKKNLCNNLQAVSRNYYFRRSSRSAPSSDTNVRTRLSSIWLDEHSFPVLRQIAGVTASRERRRQRGVILWAWRNTDEVGVTSQWAAERIVIYYDRSIVPGEAPIQINQVTMVCIGWWNLWIFMQSCKSKGYFLGVKMKQNRRKHFFKNKTLTPIARKGKNKNNTME